MAENKHNCFIKLLILEDEKESLLLYGFAVPTEQPIQGWRKAGTKKTLVVKAILSASQASAFIDSLTKPEPITAGSWKFASPMLVRDAETFCNDGGADLSGPAGGFCLVTRLWNVRKRALLYDIERALGKNDEKHVYQRLLQLWQWVKQESGADLIKDGARLGNFEWYRDVPGAADFEVICKRDEKDEARIVIMKKRAIQEDVWVHCAAMCRGQSVINPIRILPALGETVVFSAKEPIDGMLVQIWDADSGDMLFFKKENFLMNLGLNMNVVSPSYHISDPWSEMLLRSAPNRTGQIERDIERVARETPSQSHVIRGRGCNEIDAAREEGWALFSAFSSQIQRGAFIWNDQKDGEIDSFLKIQSYIAAPSVQKVMIVDPYFSVKAAAKLLARIPRTDVRIEIITSLGGKDPDTGNAIDAAEACKSFMGRNRAILHRNLTVINLTRGKDPAFHDRYLIRFWKNGKVDGFLLSNSLNSMGQKYPFITAPMETEICVEVCAYLQGMQDENAQKKLPVNERIKREVLFDARPNRVEAAPEQAMPAWFSWFARWQNADGELLIPKDDMPAAAAIIQAHWQEQPVACQALCGVCGWMIVEPYKDWAKIICGMEPVNREFAPIFASLAMEAEERESRQENREDMTTRELRALLTGRAQPARQGFHLLLEQAGHLMYADDSRGVLTGGYELLLEMSPRDYVRLLRETKSPLMFDRLALRMIFEPWSAALYHDFMETDVFYVELLCAEWVFVRLKAGDLSSEDLKSAWGSLLPEKRIFQSVYLLSRITYSIRMARDVETEKNQWRAICDGLLNFAAADLPLCDAETREKAVFWLFDCEEKSNCGLRYGLAMRVEKANIRNQLLDRALEDARISLLQGNYEKNVAELADLYAAMAEERHGGAAEDFMFRDMIKRSVFETAAEPALKNYNYPKWHQNHILAKRQMAVLEAFHRKHPDAEKTGGCIDRWRERLRMAEFDSFCC